MPQHREVDLGPLKGWDLCRAARPRQSDRVIGWVCALALGLAGLGSLLLIRQHWTRLLLDYGERLAIFLFLFPSASLVLVSVTVVCFLLGIASGAALPYHRVYLGRIASIGQAPADAPRRAARRPYATVHYVIGEQSHTWRGPLGGSLAKQGAEQLKGTFVRLTADPRRPDDALLLGLAKPQHVAADLPATWPEAPVD